MKTQIFGYTEATPTTGYARYVMIFIDQDAKEIEIKFRDETGKEHIMTLNESMKDSFYLNEDAFNE